MYYVVYEKLNILVIFQRDDKITIPRNGSDFSDPLSELRE